MTQTERNYNRWRNWKSRQLERDLKFCHPRWPEEKKYLQSELQQIRSFRRVYFRQPWNIFEWVSYLVVLAMIITRVFSLYGIASYKIHEKFYPAALVILWIRFLRSCRPFESLGPFIAILGSCIIDTLKFIFLFFEFFVPFTVGFWILFGGKDNGKLMGSNAIDWERINDIMFSLWQVSIQRHRISWHTASSRAFESFMNLVLNQLFLHKEGANLPFRN